MSTFIAVRDQGPAANGGANRATAEAAPGRRGLPEVRAELLGLEAVKSRPYPVEEIRFGADRAILGPDSYVLGSQCRQRLCRRLGIPGDYFERLSPELRGQLLNHHFQHKDYKAARLRNDNTSVLTRGAEVVDVVRDDLLTLPSADVIWAVQEGVGSAADSVLVRQFNTADEAFVLELVSERVAIEVRPGDVILGGLRVKHSSIGEFATSIEAFALRLVCANGLTRLECVRRRTARSTPRTRRLGRQHGNAFNLQFEQVRHLVAETWQSLEPKLENVRNLRNRPFAWDQLEGYLAQARFRSSDLRNRLHQAWETEGSDTTAFGALNALSRLSSHDPTLSSRQRVQLERLAGMFASHGRVCPHCLSILRNH